VSKAEDWKYTKEDLKWLQSLPLEQKIQVTQTRLIEWYNHFDGKIYISFSGGKDSTVLADIAARLYASGSLKNSEENPLTLVFINTGLEYPEIQKFVKKFSDWLKNTYHIPVCLEILHPEMSFVDVIKKYGYPVISKEVSERIYSARRGGIWAINQLNGLNCSGDEENKYAHRFLKYKYLFDAPFDIAKQCCNIMKKKPAHQYNRKSGKKPVIATMTEESKLRENGWRKNGCNAFQATDQHSNPMSFWTEQDVLNYLKRTGVPYASVYGEIIEKNGKLVTTKCNRTGCMFCMFGVQRDREPNRFQRMKETHPRQYEYCIGGGHFEDGKLQPDKNGLGLGMILDYIGIPY